MRKKRMDHKAYRKRSMPQKTARAFCHEVVVRPLAEGAFPSRSILWKSAAAVILI